MDTRYAAEIPKPSKTILIAKPEYGSKAAEIFDKINIKITLK